VSFVPTEARRLLALATPVIITQLGMMMMGVVDVIMVGRVGVDALDGASLGRVWVFGTLLFGMGIVMGIDPIVAQAHGSRNTVRLSLALQQGLIIAALATVPVALCWIFTEEGLLALGQDPLHSRLAESYALVQLPSIPVFLGYSVLRQYLQGRGIVRPAMWIALLANGVNVFLNWIFIYGHLGAPALGVTGAGLATALTRGFMLLSLVGMVLRGRLYEGAWHGWTREALGRKGLAEVWHFGLPVGLQLGFEIWAFDLATLFAGRLGKVELAAHVIALNLASLCYMVPLGVSMAAVTRVGNLIGEGKRRAAQDAAWTAMVMGAGFMALSAILIAVFREAIPRIYSSDAAVIAAAAAVLPIAAAFQVFDGTQAVGMGILRSMGRTRPAAVFNFIGYYVLALPLAWWLGFSLKQGLPGIWWGLSLGLAVIAIALVVWVWRRGPARVDARVVDAPPEAPAGP
jgi:MATE family multidrug resistance protein